MSWTALLVFCISVNYVFIQFYGSISLTLFQLTGNCCQSIFKYQRSCELFSTTQNKQALPLLWTLKLHINKTMGHSTRKCKHSKTVKYNETMKHPITLNCTFHVIFYICHRSISRCICNTEVLKLKWHVY